MDVHSKETRSYNMSRIKGKATKPEETVCKYLFHKGLRYRKNVRKLPGCPDIVLSKHKIAIFVNGCFWHVHEDCPYFVWPKNNREFWREKLTRNKQRDKENYVKLEQAGWRVLIVWECELKKATRLTELYSEIMSNKSDTE